MNESLNEGFEEINAIQGTFECDLAQIDADGNTSPVLGFEGKIVIFRGVQVDHTMTFLKDNDERSTSSVVRITKIDDTSFQVHTKNSTYQIQNIETDSGKWEVSQKDHPQETEKGVRALLQPLLDLLKKSSS